MNNFQIIITIIYKQISVCKMYVCYLDVKPEMETYLRGFVIHRVKFSYGLQIVCLVENTSTAIVTLT